MLIIQALICKITTPILGVDCRISYEPAHTNIGC